MCVNHSPATITYSYRFFLYDNFFIDYLFCLIGGWDMYIFLKNYQNKTFAANIELQS